METITYFPWMFLIIMKWITYISGTNAIYCHLRAIDEPLR